MPNETKRPCATRSPRSRASARRGVSKSRRGSLPGPGSRQPLGAEDRTKDPALLPTEDLPGDPLVRYLTTRKESDFEALDAVVRKQLYRIAYRVLGRHDLAENVVQDVFLLVLTGEFSLGTPRCGVEVLCSQALADASMVAEALDSDDGEFEYHREYKDDYDYDYDEEVFHA